MQTKTFRQWISENNANIRENNGVFELIPDKLNEFGAGIISRGGTMSVAGDYPTMTELIAGLNTIRYGSVWYSGDEIDGENTTPSVFNESGIEMAELHDIYLNSNNGNVYICDLAGNAATAKWTYTGNLRGVSGVYVGAGPMPVGYNIQIDPTEETDDLDSIYSAVSATLAARDESILSSGNYPLITNSTDTDITIELRPSTEYIYTAGITSLTFTFGAPLVNYSTEYRIKFRTDAATAPTIVEPNAIIWSPTIPVFEANKWYELSFVILGDSFSGIWSSVDA